MNKKLYIQPSFREVITQLDAYMDILSANADGEKIEILCSNSNYYFYY